MINKAANMPTTNNNRQTNISDNKQITNNLNITTNNPDVANKSQQTFFNNNRNDMLYNSYNN